MSERLLFATDRFFVLFCFVCLFLLFTEAAVKNRKYTVSWLVLSVSVLFGVEAVSKEAT